MSRRDAMNDIMDHTSTSVNYHKMVLSPGEDEPIADWREWTRDVMRDLEGRQGRKLHWYAVHHDNTDNPHVHVVLAGAGENHETGKEEAVKLYANDYQFLRASGHAHSEHDWYRQLGDYIQEYDQQDHVEPSPERVHVEREPSRETGRDFDGGDFDR